MKVCSVCGRCYENSTISCTEENHPPLTARENRTCEMLAGYRLEFLLESGGKYEIYRARHLNSAQSCLIKFFTGEPETNQEILREAKIAAGIFQPNVVGIRDAGALENGEIFIITEDAGERTLRDYLNDSAIPLVDAIQIARQTAEALHSIHQANLTHRAVNPENIVLTSDADGRLLVKIQNFDFGGVNEKIIANDKFLSAKNLNALKYFAPEQCAGKPTNAADVYGLGVVFYEMLSGKPPFDAPTAAALIEKQKNQPPPEIKINNFDLRMLLTHTLMEALRKSPERRHASVNVFARQLRHIEQLATHSSTPPPVVAVKSLPAKPVVAAAVLTENPLVIETPEPAETTHDFQTQNDALAVTDETAVESILEAENLPAIELETAEETIAAPEIEAIDAFNYENKPEIGTANAVEFASVANLENPAVSTPEIRETAELSFEENAAENSVEKDSAPLPEVAEDVAETPKNPYVTTKLSASQIAHIKPFGTPTEEIGGESTVPASKQTEGDISSKTGNFEFRPREISTETVNRYETADLSNADVFPPDETESSFQSEQNEKATFDARDALFSTYNVSPSNRFSLSKRSILIGGGFLALLVLLLLGYALINGRAGLREPITAKTDSPQKPQPPTPQLENAAPVSANEPATLENPADVPAGEENAGSSRSKSTFAVERPPVSGEKSAVSTTKTVVRNQPPPTPVVKPDTENVPRYTKDGNLRFPPTVIVIPERGKSKTKAESEKKPAAKKQSSTAKGNDVFARPRVVKNPRP